MKAQCELNGFKDIKVLEKGESTTVGNFLVRLIPPLNSIGLEFDQDHGENQLCIDAGYRLDNLDTSLSMIFLADNSLYNESAFETFHHLLDSPDLIAFAYSGFASDYPFYYDFSFKEMIRICNELENKRFSIQSKILKKIRPKYILPYSSEFIPVGSHSSVWMDCYPEIWTSDKDFVAKKYATEVGCDAGTLYPDEELIFELRNPNLVIETFDRSAIIKKMIDYRQRFESLEDNVTPPEAVNSLGNLVPPAAENYFSKLVSLRLAPRFDFHIYCNEEFLFGIRNDTRKLQSSEFDSKNLIKIKTDATTLIKLLSGVLHWDDACLSFRLKWARVPNLFDIDSYNSLHYLRVIPVKPTPPQP